ncbi:hypothetical protein AGMMS49990_04010 [Endomicrobiia bacterium]|nr:hypothetical protein AGMMS49990_04010 [Endomicrobiia bacterium]
MLTVKVNGQNKDKFTLYLVSNYKTVYGGGISRSKITFYAFVAG